MENDQKLSEVVRRAKECAKSGISNRKNLFNQLFSDFETILGKAFSAENKTLSEEEFVKKQKCLQYVTFSLALICEKRQMKIDSVIRLLRLAFTSICSIKDAEMAGSFDRLLSVLLIAASKLGTDEYERTLKCLLELLKYCEADTSSSVGCPDLLTSQALARILNDSDAFFTSQLSQNIIGCLFGPYSDVLPITDTMVLFWPHCKSFLQNPKLQKESWVVSNCLRAALKILKQKVTSGSTVEQTNFISDLFSILNELKSVEGTAQSVLRELFTRVKTFLNEHGKVISLKKELRESTIGWMHVYMKFIGENNDRFQLLEVFSEWMVNLTAHEDVYEVTPTVCAEPIAICLKRVKTGVERASECLHNYLDILVSLFKLSRIQNNFQWVEEEVQKRNSLDNQHWPLLLKSLLSVQHPVCQQFFKKFAPSAESLWAKIKSGDSSQSFVNSIAILVGSCRFLGGIDEGGKQIIPILLLPCFGDFRAFVGSKWDTFRLVGGGRTMPTALADLERYTQVIDDRKSEHAKLQAVACGLQIEKKTGKYVSLVADMALAVLAKTQSEKIVNCLPALYFFLTENPTFIADFVNLLIGKLCEKQSVYTEETIIEICRSVKDFICLSANRKNHCLKCEKNKNTFVTPDEGEIMNLDEKSLHSVVKGILEKKQSYSEVVVSELLDLSRVVLLHVNSPRLPTVFVSVVKASEIMCSKNSEAFIRVWELIDWRSSANDEAKLQVYIPVLNRLFSMAKDKHPSLLNQFMKNVLHAKLSVTVKVVVLASMFADSVVAEYEDSRIIAHNWIRRFSRQIMEDIVVFTEDEAFPAIMNRYAGVFTRSFISRLLFDHASSDGSKVHFDESKTRELIRAFVTEVAITFKLRNLMSSLLVLRPHLLYWSLVSGARGQSPKVVCAVIDFLCQELVVASTSTAQLPADPSNAENVMKQRNALIKELFQNLVQYGAFETCKGNESIWKFCADYCQFSENDMKHVTSAYRKDVFECLLLVSPEDIDRPQNITPIVAELQKTYENARKGEKFCVATATRDKGTEIFFTFRAYFTNDSHFWMRERVAVSFRYVLEHLKSDFFDNNWYAILSALRYSPPTSEATRLSWIKFIERIQYATLRTNLWRIMTDVTRVEQNEKIIEQVWLRLSYSKDISTLTTDPIIVKFFWLLPLEIEKKENFHLCIAKSRRIEDAFDFINHFPRYPSLLFINHLSSKLERGTIWRDDLPKLIGALTRILPICQSAQQREKICEILHKVPILNSENVDHQFVRWDPSNRFFTDSNLLTNPVLDECAWVVESQTAAGRIEYADRTMCEIFKHLTENERSRGKSWLDGLTDMYAKMTKRKPDPQMIDEKTIDQLSCAGKSAPFARWLTALIVKCAKVAEGTPLASLIPIAHISDTRFLAKLAMRFILPAVFLNNGVTQWILTTFEDALMAALHRKKTKRGPAAFVFFVFDFLYFYMNSEDLRKERATWERVTSFWKNMMQWTINDDYGHEQPLIVKVAETLGMEKRCILWLDMFMEQKKRNGVVESEKEAAYYFTLVNLYSRIHELNAVRGAYAQLVKVQSDHVFGKVCLREAFGEVASAQTLARMTGKGKAFNQIEEIRKLIDEANTVEHLEDVEANDDQIESLKQLTRWMKVENDIGPSTHVFARTIEERSIECKIVAMIQSGEDDEAVVRAIGEAKEDVLERLAENALGGFCSYETATPYMVRIQQLDEISKLKDASIDNLIGFDTEFWKNLHKRTDESEQRMDVLEPILRVRRSLLENRMKSMGDRDKDQIRSRIVEAHLQSARIARLSGCQERAQLSIINAKKVLPFDNKIVLEEAKLQLQTSDELSGMNLLDSILDKTFGELSKHYGDTQQSTNLVLQNSARSKIELFPAETKNLFSSVQMLRISHMIKAGNTIGFEKIYNDTTNLLQAFVSSGVMYEAAWLLDYLFHYNERNRHVLPLLKAYKEVAKYENNHVLRARAVERMMSLWLSNTRKINGLITGSKVPNAAAQDMVHNIKTMNLEIQSALEHIGWSSFYPAYAVLTRHIDHQDEDVFRTIKNIMNQLILRLPHQCMWQSVYLLRQDIAEVKKRYMEVLSAVKRKGSCYVTLIDQYDYASAVFNQVPEKVDSDSCKLSEKVEGLDMLFRKKRYDPKELIMDRRVDGECKALFGIMVPIRSVIDGSVHAEEHIEEGFLGACVVPDRYLIHDFSDKVKVLHSKTKPVLIELTTMAGRKIRLICKKEDDLTKDYYFTKMVEMCNDLLIKDEQTRIQNMTATTYSVIPLAKQGGIIEFMEGVTPYYETLDKLIGKTLAEWSEMTRRWAAKMKTLKKEDKAIYFRKECCAQTPLVMAKWFRLQYPEAGKWFACRKLFAKSSAVMSMVGYIFGLGDRHTKNLMVHLPTGKCIHVDFDMIFNKGELLGTPEVVPFRLTRNMINGMGEVALEGEFRTVCEQTLRVFRENSYEIEKYIADLPNLVSDFNLKDFDMTEAKRLISGRLRGQIMTAKLYRSNPISHPMQVSQLASSLIELATSDEKLCEMFEGWMPTL